MERGAKAGDPEAQQKYAVFLVTQALEAGPTPESRQKMTEAEGYFQSMNTFDPVGSLIQLCKLYMRTGRKEDARQVAADLMSKIVETEKAMAAEEQSLPLSKSSYNSHRRMYSKTLVAGHWMVLRGFASALGDRGAAETCTSHINKLTRD
jgi:hypothetical protein